MASEQAFFNEVCGLVDRGYTLISSGYNPDKPERWAILYGNQYADEPEHLATVSANGIPGAVSVTYHTTEQFRPPIEDMTKACLVAGSSALYMY